MPSGGNGEILYRDLLLAFLISNTLFIIIYSIRAIIWVLWKRKKEYFKKYVGYNPYDVNPLQFLVNILFVIINGLLILITIIKWLASIFNSII